MNDDITEERLIKALGISSILAAGVAVPLNNAAKDFEICGPKSRAAWVAQIAHESGNFQRLEENLNYSAKRLAQVWPSRFRLPREGEIILDRFPDGRLNAEAYARRPEKIANEVYANRMGNGPPESGDGWRFRGRGYIQLTGRANYAAYTVETGVDVMQHPDLLTTPRYAAHSAAWFWQRIDGCKYVREGDFEGLTRRINGGLTGIEDRRALLSAVEEQFVA
jgi:putative chitinase